MNNSIKKYIKDCKLLFAIYGRKEREYIKKVKQNLIDMSLEDEYIDYDKIVERYGDPFKVITSYYEQEGYPYILKKAKSNSFIKKTLILFVVLVFSFLCYRSYNLYQQYMEIKNDSNGYFEVTIN